MLPSMVEAEKFSDHPRIIYIYIYIFFFLKETKIINWNRFFVHHRTLLAVKRVVFVSDMISQ